MGTACSSCTKGNTNEYSKRDVAKQRLMVTSPEGDDLTRVSVSMSSTTRPLDDAQLGDLIGMMAGHQELMLGTPTAPDAVLKADPFADAGQPIQTRGSMYEIDPQVGFNFQTVNTQPKLNSMGSTVDALMGAPEEQGGGGAKMGTREEAHGQGTDDESDIGTDTDDESSSGSSESSSASEDDEMKAMREQMAMFKSQIATQMAQVDKESALDDRAKETKKKVIRQQSLYKWSHTQLKSAQSDMEDQLALLSKQLGGGEDPSAIHAIMAQRRKEQDEAHITPIEKRRRKRKKKNAAAPIIEEADEEEDELM